MVEAVKIAEAAGPDLIDLNFGCPVKKIAVKGAGSGMLKTPDLLLEITERVVKAVKVPVTVKTRLVGMRILLLSKHLLNNCRMLG